LAAIAALFKKERTSAMGSIRWSVLLPVLVLLPVGAVGEVRLPAVIGENMVLQQGRELPIWGWAAPGEKVTVTLAGTSRSAEADADGAWRVRLPAMQAGGPHEMTVAGGENTITLRNVMVGEVWLCSGQSNMFWEVRRSADAEQEIADANYPDVRLFSVTKKTAEQPLQDVRGRWSECDPNTVADFSAVAYFFGRELLKNIHVPIGLIHSSVGGSAIELWMPREVLMADPEFWAAVAKYEEGLESYQAKKVKQYEEALAKWQTEAEQAKAEGKELPQEPSPPKPPPKGSVFYNGMIHPLAPFAIAGVIWYQGETNVGKAELYARLFPAMIASWRGLWGQGDFPFLFVQLANYKPRQEAPADSDWARLREAQLKSLSVPRTALAVAIDLGDANDIHSANKQDVGRRLALAAMGTVYGKEIVFSGPIFSGMEIRGDEAVLSFNHIGSGLVAHGDALAGFAVAGADGKFFWAQARIEGDQVVVFIADVPQPVAVRYGWADNPECNLYNQEGLPASPFRTDDWPRQQPATTMAAE
jgi:sialate O-acetylesterase